MAGSTSPAFSPQRATPMARTFIGLQQPAKQPYGVIDCSFLDPNGNHVRFSQVL